MPTSKVFEFYCVEWHLFKWEIGPSKLVLQFLQVRTEEFVLLTLGVQEPLVSWKTWWRSYKYHPLLSSLKIMWCRALKEAGRKARFRKLWYKHWFSIGCWLKFWVPLPLPPHPLHPWRLWQSGTECLEKRILECRVWELCHGGETSWGYGTYRLAGAVLVSMVTVTPKSRGHPPELLTSYPTGRWGQSK